MLCWTSTFYIALMLLPLMELNWSTRAVGNHSEFSGLSVDHSMTGKLLLGLAMSINPVVTNLLVMLKVLCNWFSNLDNTEELILFFHV